MEIGNQLFIYTAYRYIYNKGVFYEMKKIHCHLKDLFNERNMSQEEIAGLSKVNESTINSLYNNELNTILKKEMCRLLKLLKLTIFHSYFQ
ncbi:helix-turn-helix domain-containing protein [Neobacillus sp. NRS-1170]|uniref:helix-turn-helix domain-containing protein n=1 Tax=Neobacillus sp. NRS-1170 TaxID=3233898 RepID=UPI003D27BE9B